MIITKINRPVYFPSEQTWFGSYWIGDTRFCYEAWREFQKEIGIYCYYAATARKLHPNGWRYCDFLDLIAGVDPQEEDHELRIAAKDSVNRIHRQLRQYVNPILIKAYRTAELKRGIL